MGCEDERSVESIARELEEPLDVVEHLSDLLATTARRLRLLLASDARGTALVAGRLDVLGGAAQDFVHAERARLVLARRNTAGEPPHGKDLPW